MPLNRWSILMLSISLLGGCASYGKISNQHILDNPDAIDYSIRNRRPENRSRDLTLVLAFSGGGTRAAALSYGVLQALHDQFVLIDGKPRRMIDEIDLISSVSGGSFTAAYYGLHGHRIFDDFETRFLRRDIAGELVNRLFSPALWFSSRGRTEMAIRYYEENVFADATFADLYNNGGPMIVINASDMGRSVRFSFLQEYFNLLCSDLSSFPVARAVTASSAVPILFNPVILKNHPDCDGEVFEFLDRARDEVKDSPQLTAVVNGLSSYRQKDIRQYIHLVDGGLTDNLGLLAIYDFIEVAGGIKPFLRQVGGRPAKNIVVISVNASTSPQYAMELSNKVPTIEDTINAISDTQLHSANARTLDLIKFSMQRWADEISTDDLPIEPYFVQIDFNSIRSATRRLFFNQIPVTFTLDNTQVDNLIEAGKELLLNNPEFQRLLKSLNTE